MADPALLSVVEEAFALSGRTGLVIVPGIPAESALTVKTGDELLLRRPDGCETLTHVAGIEMVARRILPATPQPIPLMLGPNIDKDLVPAGTEVFVVAPRYT